MGSQNDSIKRVKMIPYRCQPKRSQEESKWLSWKDRPGVQKTTPLKESKWLFWIKTASSEQAVKNL